MKAIFDRVPTSKKFPLFKLLLAIQSVTNNSGDQPVSILKLGGVGKAIWAYESQLDVGIELVLPFSDLQTLAEAHENFVDELLGIMGSVCFGISDSTFLFVQVAEKETELKIASYFESVRDIPDITMGITR
jgi:hypothetical protein